MKTSRPSKKRLVKWARNAGPLSHFMTSGGPCSANKSASASTTVAASSCATASQSNWCRLARSRTFRIAGKTPSIR